MRLFPLSFVLILLFFAPVVSATDIFFMPHELSVEPNELFNVTIWVSPTETIDTVATDLLTWNPAALDCISIEHGDLFTETTIWIPGTIDNEKGQILNMVWASSTPANNSGVYVTMRFKAKQATTTLVIVKEKSGVARIGNDLSFVIKNACVVNVNGGSVNIFSYDDAFCLITGVIIFLITLLTVVYLVVHRKKK